MNSEEFARATPEELENFRRGQAQRLYREEAEWAAAKGNPRPAQDAGEAQDAPKYLAEVGEAGDQSACPSLDYHGRTFYFPWRGVVRDLTAAERKRLRAEIQADGVLAPVVIDEFDNVIDGDNRLHLAFAQGVHLSDIPFCCLPGKSFAWKADRALKLNLARRHLTPEEQEKLLADRAARGKGKSSRAHARDEGIGKKAAHKDRLREVPPRGAPATQPSTSGAAKPKSNGTSGTVTGLDGKNYPAQKPAPEAPATCPKNSLLAAVLHYLDGLPLREIAREVEVPEGTFRGHWEKYRPEVEAHVEKERLRREAAAPKDELGRPIPEGRLRDIFDYRELIDNACARQNQNTALVNRLLNETLFNSPQARRISVESRVASQNLYQHLYNPRPFAVCLQCGGRAGSCKDCASTGWMTLDQYREFAGLPSSAPRFEACAECKGKRTKSCKGGCHGTGLVLKAGGGK